MFIEKIFLQNFKNHAQLELNFDSKINFIAGANGSGKTNLLDAIHYLSLTKSAFYTQDNNNIKDQEDYFAIQGWIHCANGETYQVLCSHGKGHRKTVKVNKQPYERLFHHIGRFPLVIITPFDNDLVREGSEARRKFIDTMLSQVNQEYLSALINYEHFLKQRNGLLKQYQEKQYLDKELLEIYDEQLISLAKNVFSVRNAFVKEFEPLFQFFYQKISDSKEIPRFEYVSQLSSPDFESLYKAALAKDLILQRTTQGIHKDDYSFSLNGFALKNYGSQGQQKSFVIALKLANYQIIKSKKGFSPFLLLDDIFEKLDENRIQMLLEIICSPDFGQVFITDARIESSSKFFSNLYNVRIFDFNNLNTENHG